MSLRTLVARIDDALVGQLQETAGLWSFQYSEAWLSAPAHNIKLAVTLHDARFEPSSA